MTFSKKANVSHNTHFDEGSENRREYVVDTGDNYLFKEIQVNDISSITDENTTFYEDYDTPVYRAAAMLEEKRVKFTHKEDKSLVFDCKNITSFKGRKRSDVATEGSELGLYNVDRELQGLDPLKPSDFDKEEYQVLNGDEDKLLETAKIQLLQSMKNTRIQYGINKIIPVLGQGSCFRENTPTVRKYKGNRESTLRPLLLKKLRAWMIEERGAIDTSEILHNGEHVECDDYIEIVASEGYQAYRKTGVFSIGVISSDKDSLNSPKLIVNRDTLPKKTKNDKPKLKFPKPMLIEATDKSVGDVVMISKDNGKDFKGYGFKFLMYQAFLGEDSADNYSAIRHLGLDLGFGDVAAYKVLKPCKTAKETLQSTLDTMFELFPKGVEYTSWQGEDLHVDTMTYMNTYFNIAYMLRKLDDKMDFYKLCKAFKVDYSKLVDNHIEKPKILAPEGTVREVYSKVTEQLESMSEVLSQQKGTKPVLVENMQKADELVSKVVEEMQGLFIEEKL